MSAFQFVVPNLGDAPSEALIDKLHTLEMNWEGDDSGMVFHNDSFEANQNAVNAAPGDVVVVNVSASVYKNQQEGIELCS
jgi:hypothetical protein